MTDAQPNSNGYHPADDDSTEEAYEPGDTLHRGTSIACGLLLLFFALLSCGFVVSVLSQRH
jgi:hypothetical protein